MAAEKAAKNMPSIADAEPETTRFLRGVFERMMHGEGDPGLFTAEMQKVMFPDNIKQLKGPLGIEVLKGFELLTADGSNAAKHRVYRATFDSGLKARVDFTLDAQGKIAGANVRPE